MCRPCCDCACGVPGDDDTFLSLGAFGAASAGSRIHGLGVRCRKCRVEGLGFRCRKCRVFGSCRKCRVEGGWPLDKKTK